MPDEEKEKIGPKPVAAKNISSSATPAHAPQGKPHPHHHPQPPPQQPPSHHHYHAPAPPVMVMPMIRKFYYI